MPDNKRIDLSSDLDQLSGDLLRDVREAAESEKKRQEDIKYKGSREAEKVQSRKTTLVLAVVAAVVILCLACWMVFKPGEEISQVKLQGGQQQKVTIKTPTTVPTTRQVPRTVPMQGRQPQQRDASDYDQPSSDPGM